MGIGSRICFSLVTGFTGGLRILLAAADLESLAETRALGCIGLRFQSLMMNHRRPIRSITARDQSKPQMVAFHARRYNPAIGELRPPLSWRGESLTGSLRKLVMPMNTFVARKQVGDPTRAN